MRRSLTVATVLALALGSGAAADVYRWTDEAGKLHFTSHLDEVPARYHEQAQGGAKAAPGNVTIVEGDGRPPGTPPRAPSPFSRHAYDPAPAQDAVPDLGRPNVRSGKDAAPERRFETKCDSRGENCRRYQTQEFKDWKNRQPPVPASSDSGD